VSKNPPAMADPQGLPFRSADGTQLVAHWHPAARGRALPVLLAHGFGEHSGRYDHVVAALVERGFGVLRFDFRGHGESAGKRGHVQRFERYVDDLDAASKLLRDRSESPRHLSLAHSYGGLITTLWLAERRPPVNAFACTSPAFGFAVALPAWRRGLANCMSHLWPSYSEPNRIDRSILTHDPLQQELHWEDRRNGNRASARFYTESLVAQRRALDLAPSLELPRLILAAGDDQLVSTPAIERFAAASRGPCELRVLDGAYHELFNELPEWRAPALEAVLAFFERHGDPGAERAA
jgi:lysophospholipase